MVMIFLGGTVALCAQASPPHKYSGDHVTASLIKAAVDQAHVVCAEPGASCPSGVAMLAIRSHGNLTQCTAFLVSDHAMLTNSHCIPAELKARLRTGAVNCSDSLTAIFPRAAGFSEERVRCSKVVMASQITTRLDADFAQRPDYALFTLERSLKRTPFRMSRAGLPDGIKLTSFVVDPVSGHGLGGNLRKKTCAARQNSVVAPSFIQDKASVGVFDRCQISSGNSGSPAIDESGHVRAIVHAALPPRLQFALSGKSIQRLNDIGYMTNAACTDLPTAAGQAQGHSAPGCRKSLSRDDLVHSAYLHVDDHLLDQMARAWLVSQKTKPFVLKIERVEPIPTSHMVMPQLYCIKDPAGWRPENAPDKAVVSTSMPVWGYSASLDSSYRLNLVPSKVDELDISFSFSASQLQRNGYVTARVVTHEKSHRETEVNPRFRLIECVD